MSLSTPTAGVQVSQRNNEDLAASPRRTGVSDPEGRKRRRITPTNFVPTPSAGPLPTGSGVRNGSPDVASSAQPGTWDFLAKWETEDSSIVADIEEEGKEDGEEEEEEEEEEEYYSVASGGSPSALEDTDQEDREEGEDVPPEGPAIRPSKLVANRVVEIINECIEKYANAWRPGKGETMHKGEEGQTEVPVVYDADALWDQAHAAGERKELAEKYELEAEYYRQRLNKLCDEIAKDSGDTEAAVKMRCRNLEVTVELLERAIWLEGIYKLPPDASSDDEAQGSDADEINQTSPSALQTSEQMQRSRIPSQVIDLGSPPASECSDDEDVPCNNITTTPLQIEHSSEPGPSIESRPSFSDPVVFDTVETPTPVVVAPTFRVARSRVPLGDAPEHASIASVSCWSWTQLEETQDRKRAVSRAIYEMSSTDREAVRRRLQKAGRTNMIREIPACVEMLSRGDKRMPGVLPQDLPKILNFTRLFLCWWLCGNYLQKEPSQIDLEELADCLREYSPDPSTFCDYVDTVLGTTFSLEALNKPSQPSQAEIIEISDDEEPSTQMVNRRRAHIDRPDPIALD